MGCYMSTPDDQVHVTEGKGRNFSYATASCQGWRREQEDAEACIPDFDDDASMFILCDGHGGAEVAKYTVEHFPGFLKEHPLYKEGKYEQALEQAFIDFDATLRTDDVMNELTKLAFDEDKAESDDNEAMDCKEESKTDKSDGPATNVEVSGSSAAPSGSSSTPSGSSGGPSSGPSSSSCQLSATTSSIPGPSNSNGAVSIVDDVDTDTLRREAQVPIEELICKYANKERKGRILSLRQSVIGNSPVIKSKDHTDSDTKPDTLEPSSSTNDAGDQPGPSASKASENPTSTSNSNQAKDSNMEVIRKLLTGTLEEMSDSDFDSDFDGLEESTSDEEDEEEDEDGDDECDDDVTGEKTKNKRLLNKKQRRSVTDRDDISSEDDDDSNDDDDDDSDDFEDSEDEEEEEDDDDEEEEEDDDDEEDDVSSTEEDEDEESEDDGGIISGKFLQRKLNQNLKASRVHRPVMDSGCTVVVALVKGSKLYVGSAGDSRCIVIMRDGQCKPMSFDHKPEDPIEHRRIRNAGGQVVEGRVNGGLNLSRAFGDFTYKNTSLDAKEQMITPCPDVRVIDLDPDQVEYIFLACDGIWNSMKNQQVTKYIRKTAPTVNNDLVEICMAVFKYCLAPDTDGDGTGCDNMTCILARYQSSDEKEFSKTNRSDLKLSATYAENCSKEAASVEGQQGLKREAEDCGDNTGNKRRCLRLLGD